MMEPHVTYMCAIEPNDDVPYHLGMCSECASVVIMDYEGANWAVHLAFHEGVDRVDRAAKRGERAYRDLHPGSGRW